MPEIDIPLPQPTPEDSSLLDRVKHELNHVVDIALDKIVDGPLEPHITHIAKKDKA